MTNATAQREALNRLAADLTEATKAGTDDPARVHTIADAVTDLAQAL